MVESSSHWTKTAQGEDGTNQAGKKQKTLNILQMWGMVGYNEGCDSKNKYKDLLAGVMKEYRSSAEVKQGALVDHASMLLPNACDQQFCDFAKLVSARKMLAKRSQSVRKVASDRCTLSVPWCHLNIFQHVLSCWLGFTGVQSIVHEVLFERFFIDYFYTSAIARKVLATCSQRSCIFVMIWDCAYRADHRLHGVRCWIMITMQCRGQHCIAARVMFMLSFLHRCARVRMLVSVLFCDLGFVLGFHFSRSWGCIRSLIWNLFMEYHCPSS